MKTPRTGRQLDLASSIPDDYYFVAWPPEVGEDAVRAPVSSLKSGFFSGGIFDHDIEVGFSNDSVLAVGRNGKNGVSSPQGLQVGGGDPTYGVGGMMLVADGNASFLTVRPSRLNSVNDSNFYNTAPGGRATPVVSTNKLHWQLGYKFDADWVGKRLSYGRSLYEVTAVNSDVELEVSWLFGADTVPFSAPMVVERSYTLVPYFSGSGTCDTNGTAMHVIEGDLCHQFVNPSYFTLLINGVEYVVDSLPDSTLRNWTLTTSAGVQSGVAFEWFAYIDNESTALHLEHMGSITGHEDNFNFFTSFYGNFIRAQQGLAEYRPIYIGNSTKQDSIYVDPSGFVSIAGSPGIEAARFIYDATCRNAWAIKGGAPGFGVSLQTFGSDANVNMAFDAKGDGDFIWTRNNFAGVALQLLGSAADTGWPILASGTVPSISAGSSSSDADLWLLGKGTGNIRLAKGYVAGSVPVTTGTIAVKDVNGVTYRIPCAL